MIDKAEGTGYYEYTECPYFGPRPAGPV